MPVEAAPAAPAFPAHPGAAERDTGAAGERVTSSAATTATATAGTAATAMARRSRLCRARRFASAISRWRENGNLGTSASTDAIIASTSASVKATAQGSFRNTGPGEHLRLVDRSGAVGFGCASPPPVAIEAGDPARPAANRARHEPDGVGRSDGDLYRHAAPPRARKDGKSAAPVSVQLRDRPRCRARGADRGQVAKVAAYGAKEAAAKSTVALAARSIREQAAVAARPPAAAATPDRFGALTSGERTLAQVTDPRPGAV